MRFELDLDLTAYESLHIVSRRDDIRRALTDKGCDFSSVIIGKIIDAIGRQLTEVNQ